MLGRWQESHEVYDGRTKFDTSKLSRNLQCALAMPRITEPGLQELSSCRESTEQMRLREDGTSICRYAVLTFVPWTHTDCMNRVLKRLCQELKKERSHGRRTYRYIDLSGRTTTASRCRRSASPANLYHKTNEVEREHNQHDRSSTLSHTANCS